MYGISTLGRRRTDGRTDHHSIDSNPGLLSACFAFTIINISWLLFNGKMILYDFVQSFLHIFVTTVKMQSSILGAVLRFTKST